jgi:hypothetical protein
MQTNSTRKLKKSPILEFFLPGVAPYDLRRQIGFVLLSMLVGLIVASAFALALYQMNGVRH